jgi:hypothetical protein
MGRGKDRTKSRARGNTKRRARNRTKRRARNRTKRRARSRTKSRGRGKWKGGRIWWERDTIYPKREGSRSRDRMDLKCVVEG